MSSDELPLVSLVFVFFATNFEKNTKRKVIWDFDYDVHVTSIENYLGRFSFTKRNSIFL